MLLRRPRCRRPALLALVPLATVLLALPATSGCAARPRLLDERRTPPFAAALALGAGQREERRVVPVVPALPGSAGPVDVALHVRRAPGGAAGPVLVLQPGVLADAGTWRFLAPHLAASFDLVLVDPPGTGASARPDPRRAGAEAYSPTWLAACTLGALEAFDRGEPAPRRYVLVGHSLGGTVVLRALADPGLAARHADLRARVERAVLLAPADLALTAADERLATIRDLSDLEAGLAQGLGLLRRQVEDAVWGSVLVPQQTALRGDAARLEAALCRPDTRHAAQAMLRRFVRTDRGGRPVPAEVERLTAPERGLTLPLLVLWGRHDDTLPLAGAQRLLERLPGEQLRLLPAKHSPHIECVPDTAALIGAFARGEPLPDGGAGR